MGDDKMNLNPLKQYKAPEYPSGVDKNHSITEHFIPRRWLSRTVLTSAAIMLFASSPQMPSSHSDGAAANSGGICYASENSERSGSVWNLGNSLILANEDAARPDYTRTAGKPVMIMVLSEADAKKIVTEEFTKNKIKFELQSYNLGTKENPLIMDGYSPKEKKGYKIISREDWYEISQWRKEKEIYFDSSQNAAAYLEKQLLKKGIQCACICIPDIGTDKTAAQDSIRQQTEQCIKKMKQVKTK
jgi:hypothetical protein